MSNIFKNVLNAAANSTSTFVEKMFESEKESSAKGIDAYSFETTITILDKEGNPVMVARSTVSDKPEMPKDFKKQINIKPIQKSNETVTYPVIEMAEEPKVYEESVKTEEPIIQTVQEPKTQEPAVQKVEEPTAPIEPPVSNEVEPVMSVPTSGILNSNLSVKPIEEVKNVEEEIKEEPKATAQPKSDSTDNTAKRQKIEELLKRYSSLD